MQGAAKFESPSPPRLDIDPRSHSFRPACIPALQPDRPSSCTDPRPAWPSPSGRWPRSDGPGQDDTSKAGRETRTGTGPSIFITEPWNGRRDAKSWWRMTHQPSFTQRFEDPVAAEGFWQDNGHACPLDRGWKQPHIAVRNYVRVCFRAVRPLGSAASHGRFYSGTGRNSPGIPAIHS
jgi:hypothetical protein